VTESTDDESGESAEKDDVTGAKRWVRDRDFRIRLTERSRELIPATRWSISIIERNDQLFVTRKMLVRLCS